MELKVFMELSVVFIVFVILQFCHGYEEACDRRPLGTKTAPLAPDNRFLIEIIGVDEMYIPGEQYEVHLYSRDMVTPFIAFTISVREDTKYNEKNPRKPIALDPGQILPSPVDNNDGVIASPICNNTVIQSDIEPKTLVKALWKAPPKENQCVTVYAVLAVKPDVWYSYEGPLSKRVCEDKRKADDMQPMQNDDCRVCEEARYQLTFEGMWSYNTHPLMFPKSRDLSRFSDVVGASHSKNFYAFKYNTEASEGLKMVAEQGNTTQLELEIQSELGTNVRTIIKATGPPKTNMTTISIFRVCRDHHLVTLVCAIIPSPDWFLGVANLELCDASTNQWAKSIRLNLYPLDAGTDSGIDFESPNDETSPPQPISTAVITKDIDKEKVRPFARVQFDLIRTYSTPDCSTETYSLETNEDTSTDQPTPPTTTSEEPATPDPESPEDCPMTQWEEWLPCEGECIDNKIQGFKTRFRYHMVDGVQVGKYIENGPNEERRVPEECMEHDVTETLECEDDCEETKTEDGENVMRRIW